MHISQTCIIINIGSLNLLPYTCCASTYKATSWCSLKLQHAFHRLAPQCCKLLPSYRRENWSVNSCTVSSLVITFLDRRRCVTSTGPLVTPMGCRSMGSSMSLSSKPHSRMASYSACSVLPTPRWGIGRLSTAASASLQLHYWATWTLSIVSLENVTSD